VGHTRPPAPAEATATSETAYPSTQGFDGAPWGIDGQASLSSEDSVCVGPGFRTLSAQPPTLRSRANPERLSVQPGEPGRTYKEATMKIRTVITSAALGAALALPVAAASAPSASAATTQYAKLSITPSPEHPGYYDVVVSGHFNTTAASSTVGMRLKGDDPWFNDDLGVSRTGQAWYGDFSLYALVWHGTLNEDWEGRDEIFATVSSSTGWSASTPNVNGYF